MKCLFDTYVATQKNLNFYLSKFNKFNEGSSLTFIESALYFKQLIKNTISMQSNKY